VLKDGNIKKEDIHDVVLVGGSTRLPRFQDLLLEYFKKKNLYQKVNPDEAVAYGACVLSAMINGEVEVKGLELQDITTFTQGIETAGKKMAPLIKRGTVLPAKQTKLFTTNVNNQESVLVQVFEGES